MRLCVFSDMSEPCRFSKGMSRPKQRMSKPSMLNELMKVWCSFVYKSVEGVPVFMCLYHYKVISSNQYNCKMIGLTYMTPYGDNNRTFWYFGDFSRTLYAQNKTAQCMFLCTTPLELGGRFVGVRRLGGGALWLGGWRR